MLLPKLTRNFNRLYHQSGRIQKVPVVKQASSRIGDVLKKRRDNEASSKTESARLFEPFPFKVTEDNKVDVLRRLISPLHDIPYTEQLSSKETFCRNALRHFARELAASGTPVRSDVSRLPCRVDKIIPSPNDKNYRNKDEFSIWTGMDGKSLVVGYAVFPIGKHGNTVCVEPDGCLTMRDETKQLVSILQDFIRNQAHLPVCFALGTDGGWRRFVTKINTQGELMCIGLLNPRGLKVKQVVEDRDNFRDYVVKRCEESGLKLASLYYQPCHQNRCSHVLVPFELLHGSTSITETIGNYKFLVSPESFIQSNTRAAEIYYQTIRKKIDECFTFSSKPLIIDASCSAGVLSTQLSDMAQHVVGIDSSEMAVEDALKSAQLNGLQNIEFICANLEIVLERILEKYSKYKHETMVVCEVSKTGLHPNVSDTLRNCREVNKLVYMAPKINGTRIIRDLTILCTKGKSNSIPPFAPVLAAPVDLMPHTEDFQTIVVLERVLQ